MSKIQALTCCMLVGGCFSPTSTDPPPETSVPGTSTGGASVTSVESTDDSMVTSGSLTTGESTGESTDTSEATGSACGDGELGPGEECDDGAIDAGDGCSPNCTKEFRRVFITSMQFTGNMGGITGSHTHCQTAAESAGLPGVFRAWLSTTENSPDQDFVKSMVPYVRVDDAVIALDWEDLAEDDDLLAPILLTEFGEAPQATIYPPSCVFEDLIVVWTDTSVLGKLFNPETSCSEWKGTQGEGSVGLANTNDSGWTQACKVPCTTMAPIYCFEQ
jgi:cysteine-rich repeat protein